MESIKVVIMFYYCVLGCMTVLALGHLYMLRKTQRDTFMPSSLDIFHWWGFTVQSEPIQQLTAAEKGQRHRCLYQSPLLLPAMSPAYVMPTTATLL